MRRAIVIPPGTIALLLGATLLAGCFLGRWSGANKSETDAAGGRGSGISDGGGAFVLLVNLKFKNSSGREAFLDLIRPVCDNVRSNEGGTTLSYQVAVSDKDPLMVLVMERYSDKNHGYLEVHRSGKEFLKFRQWLKSMQERGEVDIDGQSYLETDHGFV